MLTEEQLLKLPKWAQNDIRRTQTENAEMKRDIEVLNSRPVGNGYVSLLQFSMGDDISLPDRCTIRFTPDPEKNHEYIDVMLRYGSVDVNCSGRAIVLPQASNHFEIKTDR